MCAHESLYEYRFMNDFEQFWQSAVDLLWGLPLVILIGASAIYFAWLCRMQPFLRLRHSIELLLGRHRETSAPGEISHFRALSSALSGTIGMGNIAGVAIAISLGGPGAIFWMWVAGFLGMCTKFFTCSLACMYRQEDEDGIAQGGPMHFIEAGLGRRFRPLAVMFALCGLIGCLPLFSANQLAGMLQVEWGIPRSITGIGAAIFVGVVILGGIKRVGLITSRLVPTMFVLYLVSSIIVISSNYAILPTLFADIFRAAFGGEALLGGAAGLTFKEVLVTGVKRAVFSNEAGVGTEALAHGAAQTKEPVREGLVAMLGPFIDTHIVCTLTALVILSAGVAPADSGIAMAVSAFEKSMPAMGGLLLTLVFIMFAVSTMISYSYYSVKCAWYLFGKKTGNYYIYVCLLSIPIAASWNQATAVNIIDAAFALMVIPTLSATILLAPKVVIEMRDYFSRSGL